MTEKGYDETDPLGGHDPYSSSKACAEIVSACYRKSFFSPHSDAPSPRLATARAGNVIGGGDWAEDRLVPDLVRATVSGNPIKIRNPDSIRPWQHVLEPLSAYLRLGQMLLDENTYASSWNFGPERRDERSVSELVSLLSKTWTELSIETDPQDHPHEAAVLRLNCDKAKQELAWKPVWNLETALEKTGAWFKQYHDNGQINSASDLKAYIEDADNLGLVWTK